MAITAEFTADFSQFTAAAAGATDSLANVKAAAEGMAIDHQAEMAGRAIGDLTTKITGLATEYIGAFAEEEAATAKLATALTNSGLAADGTIEAYGRMATQFQETTRFSDDAVTSAQEVLTTMGHLGPDLMEPAVQAAANLASQLGISLPDAAAKIAKVIASDGTKLGDLKSALSDVDVKGKSASEVLGIFNSKFGGAAAADMETTAGKLANLNNKFEDLKSKVGEALANALTPLLDAFMSLPGPVQSAIVLVVGLGTALAPIAIAFGSVVAAVGPLVTLLGGAGGISAVLGGVVAVLTGPVALAIGAFVLAVIGVYEAFKHWDKITAFVKAVYDGIKTWLVDGFNALVGSIMAQIDKVVGKFKYLYDKVVGSSYVPDLIVGISEEFSKLNQVMVEPATKAAEATQAVLGKAMGAIGEMAGGALAGPAAGGGGGGGVSLPGSHVEKVGNSQYLVSPTGIRVPMERTGTGSYNMPANWWQMYTGATSAPISSMFAGTPLMNAQPVNVTINGSVISTQDQMATMVQDAMMQVYRKGGNLLPV
jgi:hypothetical protein